MEEQNLDLKSTNVQKKQMSWLYLNHFAIIFSNVSIVGFVIGVMAVLSSIFVPLISVLFGILLIVGIICTFGAVFAIYPNYLSLFSKISNLIENFPYELLMKIGLYATSISIVLSVVALVLLCIDKQQKHVGRIVLASSVLALLVVALIFAIFRTTGVL